MFDREKKLPMGMISKGVRTGYLVAGAELDREKMLPMGMLSKGVRTGYLLAGQSLQG